MNGAGWFSPSYAVARDRFRAAASARGFRVESHRAIEGEDLTVDVAFGGDEGAAGRVVVSSGLHGVEGFVGSAIQLALIEGEAPPAGVGLVLVHALNPAGFAGVRRWDEGNVDLNRNFLGEGEAYSGSPGAYRRLDSLLNPRSRPGWLDPFAIEALGPIAREGLDALRAAIAGGQYDYPLGLFFGGHGPTATHRLVAGQLAGWAGGADRLIHLDVHSGLGRWAGLSVLLDDEVPEGRARALAETFASFDVQWAGGGVAYPTRGSLGPWCRRRLDGREYDYLCAEFGTYPGVKVLAALRAENRAHHFGEAGDPRTARAGRRLIEAFAPASARWREEVVARGLTLAHRSLEVVAEASAGRTSLRDRFN